MLTLSAKEQQDRVVLLGKVQFVGEKLNAVNQSKLNEYFNTIRSYELQYKEVQLILRGDTSCGDEDEEYAQSVEEMFIDRGLSPKQISLEYIRAKSAYKNCSQTKVVSLKLQARKLRKVAPLPPKIKKPKIEMIVVLLKGRKEDTAIEVKTPLAAVVVDKPNESVTITADKNISKPKKLQAKELQTLFGTTLSTSKLKRYHFVLYFEHRNLDKKSKIRLKKIIAKLKEIDNPYIEIIGHTDTVKSVKENQKNGLQRAERVANSIKKAGVKYLKMDVSSHSELDLAVQTADEVIEPLNRRVELFIQ
ncbi:OmpA family protein [Sulfurimonas sp.]|uniref:OmpA family protein n=1 Tax=Sulfurimonas sp. TaxID=2022749 RepID=UPI002626276F|nr:OmpA family protein [Sulfurimonas sp.]